MKWCSTSKGSGCFPAFTSDVDGYRKRGGDHANALVNFKGDQSAIILNAPPRIEEIEHFCGVIGTFDQLFDLAGVTSELEDAFVQQLKDRGNLPGGVYWLDRDAAQRVVRATVQKWQIKHGNAR